MYYIGIQKYAFVTFSCKLGARYNKKGPTFFHIYLFTWSSNRGIKQAMILNLTKACTIVYKCLFLVSPVNADQTQLIRILLILLTVSVILNLYLLSKRKTTKGPSEESDQSKLTQQEKKIARQVLQDKTNKEIADTLFISDSTVRTHINNLNKKLGVADREALKVQLQQQFREAD